MLSSLRDILWSLPTVFLLTGTGVYFTVKSRFYPLRRVGRIVKSVKAENDSRGISSFGGLMTALGGTVGVGSITGVAFAISTGGPGALFWMWISSFFCMMLKYAENSMTVSYGGKRGLASTVLCSMGKRKAAFLFAIMGVAASFGSGNMAQSGAFAMAMSGIGISPVAAGAIFSALLIPAVFGGQRIIAKINGVLVPVSAIVFLAAISGIILINIENLPKALSEVFKGAFGMGQISGGITGTAISLAVRTGVSKGVFSHEAGMGSSPMAYAASDTAPEKAANFGIIEVFADTFLVSTLTALALLTSGTVECEQMFFKYFGFFGGVTLAVSVGVFAYAAVISWCFYSESCIGFLFGSSKAPMVFYRAAAVAVSFLGCIWRAESVWQLSDIFNALMMFPNLYAVILKRKDIPF